jgi:hypothetical protein
MVDEERFFQYCNEINDAIWENRISKQDIEDWLRNFKSQPRIDVRKLAIDLLLGFIYYNEAEIKFLCKHAFSEYKRQRIKEKILTGQSIKAAEQSFRQSIQRTKFTGKAGDSSGYFCYYFRQFNGLPQESFINSIGEIQPDTDTLIIIDDFIGTGDSVITNQKMLKDNGLFKQFSKIQVYYISLIVTEAGLQLIQSSDPSCNLIYSELLSQDYKVFSHNTKILPDYSEENRNQAQIVCKEIGKFLEGEDNALGYKNSAL